jgi:hypothetical protein
MSTINSVWIPAGNLSRQARRVLAVEANMDQEMTPYIFQTFLIEKLERLIAEAKEDGTLENAMEIAPDWSSEMIYNQGRQLAEALPYTDSLSELVSKATLTRAPSTEEDLQELRDQTLLSLACDLTSSLSQ